MEHIWFLAQQADGANVGAGSIMLYASVGLIAAIVFGAFEFIMHRTLYTVGIILIGVILASNAPAIVNSLMHGSGGSQNTIVPTAAQ
jgi:hypothetical protein